MSCVLCENGLGKTARQAVHDPYKKRCYRCRRDFDASLARALYGGHCPLCGGDLRPAVLRYRRVCTSCGAPVSN